MRRIIKIYLLFSMCCGTGQFAFRNLQLSPLPGGGGNRAPASSEADKGVSPAPTLQDRQEEFKKLVAATERIRQASSAHWWREYREASELAEEAIQRETEEALRVARFRNEVAQRDAERVAQRQNGADIRPLDPPPGDDPEEQADERLFGRPPNRAEARPRLAGGR